MAMKRILEQMSLSTLASNFEAERIDPTLVPSMSEGQLMRLGVGTMGLQLRLKQLCQAYIQAETQESEGDAAAGTSMTALNFTSGASVNRIRRERGFLFNFNPSRQGSRRRGSNNLTSRYKREKRSCSVQCICLADRFANKVPTPSEKQALYQAGLGGKKIEFCLDDNEQEVVRKLTDDECGFPQLKNCGGFELLQCTGNRRTLDVISCKWSIKELKARFGSQVKFYLRPIQKNLSVKPVKDVETPDLKEVCHGCKGEFPVLELRQHLDICTAIDDVINSSSSEDDLPAVFEVSPQEETVDLTTDVTTESPPVSTIHGTSDGTLPNGNDENSLPEEHDVEGVEDGKLHVKHAVQQTIKYCKDNAVSNPVEILRYYQSKLIIGRALDTGDTSTYEEGDTSVISVDRLMVLQTGFDEISSLSVKQLYTTLEVDFYGERAKDYGGPRKEFFSLILREIKEKYFGDTLKEHLSEEYYLVGVILALSMLQNGKLAQFLADDVRQRLFDIEDETPCIAKLKDGLITLGIHQLCMELPTMQYLFQPNTSSALTINKLKSLLTPTFSETGTNSRRFEGEIFALFLKYLREVSSGRRGNITLNDILQFVTGAEDEPVLGFRITPSVEFVEMTQSYLPTANTCINRLTLPRPTIEQQLLPTRQMYDLYDLAFSNRFFGNV